MRYLAMSKSPTTKKDKPVKKPYSPPVLRQHGRVSQLTTGGSGMMQEMAMMGMGGMGGPNRFP